MIKGIFVAAVLLELAGPAWAQVAPDTPDPFAGKPDAVEAGHALFAKMNCAGCHGYDLTGGLGPDLTDQTGLSGGKPGEIFHTIAEGTPRGMPSWKAKLTPEQIWQIVSYVRSKGAQ
jgi:cytochrome c oxidase cbb3-type subunit 3